jgi:8-oxo-dGTP pyrophosphatase MutT (NUDIX family)
MTDYSKTVPVAKALILDASGHMLMLRRSQTHPTLAGHPDLPGGLIEQDEEPGLAVAREILEETGLVLTATSQQILYAGAEMSENENRIRFLYVIRLNEEKPAVVISWEHESYEWIAISEMQHIENDFHSFYHDALHYIRTNQLLD